MEARAYPLVSETDIIDLNEYWGTFAKSVYSCFLSISTGQSWHIVLRPLANYSIGLTLSFLAFIALTIFGVPNAITSVFVESAIMSAQHYRELIVLDKEHQKDIAVSHMKEVFNQIDDDGSGEISSDEMDFFLSNEALRKYLEALNVTAEDTRMLFRLLDKDGSGKIDIEEFCNGCLRLKGEARSFDIHVLIFQIKGFLEKWA